MLTILALHIAATLEIINKLNVTLLTACYCRVFESTSAITAA